MGRRSGPSRPRDASSSTEPGGPWLPTKVALDGGAHVLLSCGPSAVAVWLFLRASGAWREEGWPGSREKLRRGLKTAGCPMNHATIARALEALSAAGVVSEVREGPKASRNGACFKVQPVRSQVPAGANPARSSKDRNLARSSRVEADPCSIEREPRSFEQDPRSIEQGLYDPRIPKPTPTERGSASLGEGDNAPAPGPAKGPGLGAPRRTGHGGDGAEDIGTLVAAVAGRCSVFPEAARATTQRATREGTCRGSRAAAEAEAERRALLMAQARELGAHDPAGAAARCTEPVTRDAREAVA